MLALGVDPGPVPGVALWEIKGENSAHLIKMQQFDSIRKFVIYLEEIGKLQYLIYERFWIRPDQAEAFRGSKMEVVRCIGVIDSYEARHPETEIIAQVPENYRTGEKWSGLKVPSLHTISHKYVAYNHAYYWLHVQGYVPIAEV